MFLQLADASDVIVTNYSADVPDRLGIGYAALSARNPGLVFVHITGFGSEARPASSAPTTASSRP